MRWPSFFLAFGALAGLSISAFAAQPIMGTVTLARTHGAALLLWNCTPQLAQLITAKTNNAETLKTLEQNSIDILEEKAPMLSSTATSVSIRVLYEKNGDINPAYGSPTLSGVERLMTITANVKIIKAMSAAWHKEIAENKKLDGLNISVTGELPPQQ